MKQHQKSDRWYDYHEKSQAWRVMRDFGLVNRQGCAPWETWQFKSEQDLISFLDDLYKEEI